MRKNAFRDDVQAARLCRALLASVFSSAQVSDLFTLEGPTAYARILYGDRGASLTYPQQVLFLAAMTLWERGDAATVSPTLGQLLTALDASSLARVGAVLQAVAAGHEPMDRWLANVDPQPH